MNAEAFRYIFALFLSAVGDWLRIIAFNVIVVDQLHRGSSEVAGLRLCFYLTAFLAGPWASHFVKRNSKRSIMLRTSLVASLGSLALFGFASTGMLSIFVLGLIYSLMGLNWTVGCNAEDAYLRFVLGRGKAEDVNYADLERINRWRESSFWGARVFTGYLAAGLLIILDTHWLFLFDAASFGILWLCLLFMIRDQPSHSRELEPSVSDGPAIGPEELESKFFTQLSSGYNTWVTAFKEMRKIPEVRVVAYSLFWMEALTFVAWNFLPEMVRDLGGEKQDYSLLVAASGFGGLTGVVAWKLVPSLRAFFCNYLRIAVCLPSFVMILAALSPNLVSLGLFYAVGLSLCGVVGLLFQVLCQNSSQPVYVSAAFRALRCVAVLINFLVAFAGASLGLAANHSLLISTLAGAVVILLLTQNDKVAVLATCQKLKESRVT